MHNRFAFVIAVTIGVILSITHSYLAFRYPPSPSNTNGNVFNLLLGLYKLNPLKSSQVYKAFSDDMLFRHSDKHRVVMNLDSNESYVKEQVKTNLNEIEKMIHVTSKKPDLSFQRPEYNIENVDTENFNVDIVINNRIFSKNHLNSNENMDDFNSLFGHIGSNEVDNEIPVTKLLPVNDTIKRSPQVSNQNDAMFNNNDRIKSVNHIVGSLVEVDNDIKDKDAMQAQSNTMVDVIVL